MSPLAQRLSSLAQAKGLSGVALARRTGLDQSLISRFLTGARRPTQRHLLLLALAFEVEPNTLGVQEDPWVPRTEFDNEMRARVSAQAEREEALIELRAAREELVELRAKLVTCRAHLQLAAEAAKV